MSTYVLPDSKHMYHINTAKINVRISHTPYSHTHIRANTHICK